MLAFALRNTSRRLAFPSIIRPKMKSDSSRETISHETQPPNVVQVPPPPSWSISELRLSSMDDAKPDKISEEELAVLARRCLIDIRRLSAERRDQLRVDIAGIMRCSSVLLDSKNLGIDGDISHADANSRLTDQEVYDHPRGLGRMPVRSKNGSDEWQVHGSKESKAVMNMKSVKARMVTKENEKFFSIVTKR